MPFLPCLSFFFFPLADGSVRGSFIFTMQEFARELISLTVALSRIYAAERPSASRRWYPSIFSALSSVLCCCCCFRARAKKTEESSQTRRPRGLHRRICTIDNVSSVRCALLTRRDATHTQRGC